MSKKWQFVQRMKSLSYEILLHAMKAKKNKQTQSNLKKARPLGN